MQGSTCGVHQGRMATEAEIVVASQINQRSSCMLRVFPELPGGFIGMERAQAAASGLIVIHHARILRRQDFDENQPANVSRQS